MNQWISDVTLSLQLCFLLCLCVHVPVKKIENLNLIRGILTHTHTHIRHMEKMLGSCCQVKQAQIKGPDQKNKIKGIFHGSKIDDITTRLH